MPNGDPRDGFFYPTLMIDSYIITFMVTNNDDPDQHFDCAQIN